MGGCWGSLSAARPPVKVGDSALTSKDARVPRNKSLLRMRAQRYENSTGSALGTAGDRAYLLGKFGMDEHSTCHGTTRTGARPANVRR